MTVPESELTGWGDSHDEPDPDRPLSVYLICELTECDEPKEPGTDYCAEHNQQADDEWALTDEPDRWTLDAQEEAR